MAATGFDRFAGVAAILVGIGGLAFAALFAWIVAGAPEVVRSLWFVILLLGGVLTSAVLVGLYRWLREAEPEVALWGLILGLGGALGGVLHGGYQLGSQINLPQGGAALGPEAVSGGVLRFGLAGLALVVLGGLMAASGRFPRALGVVGVVGGVLLVLTYAGRLMGLISPAERVSLVVPFLYGVIAHPVFYLWLGRVFWRGTPASP